MSWLSSLRIVDPLRCVGWIEVEELKSNVFFSFSQLSRNEEEYVTKYSHILRERTKFWNYKNKIWGTYLQRIDEQAIQVMVQICLHSQSIGRVFPRSNEQLRNDGPDGGERNGKSQ